MLNNFIYAKKKSLFENALNNGLVPDEAIVFIKNTKEIWNHGTYFDGSTFDPSNIEKSIENIINNKADKTELPTKTSDLTNDSGFITINDVSVGNLLKTYTFYVDNINTSSLGYTITQSELEEIQNADIVYIFINDRKKKIQLTSKTENDSISFFGYDFGSYPSTVFSISINVVKYLDNIEVLIVIDSIGIEDYISENSNVSYAIGVCLFEEFVDGAEIAIVENVDLILDSALNNFRPVILTLINSNNDKGVLLHGPYMYYSSDDMPSIKFIGLFNDLTIECVLRPEDDFLSGTLHIKSKSEGGNTTIEGGSSDTYYLALPLGEDGQCLSSGTLTQEQFEEMASCKTLIVRTSNMSSDGISASEDIAFDWRSALIEQSDESEMKRIICSNIYPNSFNNCLTSYIFIFSSNGSECIYELIAKLIFLDSDIFDPTAVHLSDKSIYELNIPDNTESGEISEEEFNLIISSKTLILNVGMHKIVCIQRTAPEVYPDTYYFYGNFFEGVELKIVLSLLRRDGGYIYTIQTKELSSGGTIDTSNLATKTELNSKQDTITDLETIRQGAAKGATAIQEHLSLEGYTKDSDLASVAKSGSYNDLKNKPTIPSAVTESTVSGWGFTKNTGTYTMPSTGIPKSDLASAVQTSLEKADTALQSYTEQYKGTVTGVKVNGTTKNPSNGVVDLGTVITSHQDISNKLDKLVSGTNIKTINGTSILGSGDITISGGSGSSNSSSAYPLVEIETYSGGLDSGYETINPNTFYVLRGDDDIGSTGQVEIKLGEATTGVANEYLFLFTSGSTPTSLTLPGNIKWTNEPNIGTNKIYLISILNGLGTILEFDV